MEVKFDVGLLVSASEEGDGDDIPCSVDGRQGMITIDGDGGGFNFHFLDGEDMEDEEYSLILDEISRQAGFLVY